MGLSLEQSMGDLVADPRAVMLAEDTVKKMDVNNRSYAEIQALKNDTFNSLQNGNMGPTEQAAGILVNIALNNASNKLSGYDPSRGINSHTDDQLQVGHQNMVDQANATLEQAILSKNEAHITSARLIVDNLKNVTRSQNGEALQPVFDPEDTKGMEKYIAHGSRALQVKTSEEHLSTMMGDVNAGKVAD